MSQDLKWCDRGLVFSPLYFTIATSQKILDRQLKKLKVNQELGVPEKAAACVNFMKNERSETVAIVALFDHSHGLIETMALIVHEAVHIWQEIKLITGESDPGYEFEAYSVQSISQRLMTEYLRQTKRKMK